MIYLFGDKPASELSIDFLHLFGLRCRKTVLQRNIGGETLFVGKPQRYVVFDAESLPDEWKFRDPLPIYHKKLWSPVGMAVAPVSKMRAAPDGISGNLSSKS